MISAAAGDTATLGVSSAAFAGAAVPVCANEGNVETGIKEAIATEKRLYLNAFTEITHPPIRLDPDEGVLIQTNI
jgi:hypothetical protein